MFQKFLMIMNILKKHKALKIDPLLYFLFFAGIHYNIEKYLQGVSTLLSFLILFIWAIFGAELILKMGHNKDKTEYSFYFFPNIIFMIILYSIVIAPVIFIFKALFSSFIVIENRSLSDLKKKTID